MRDYRVAGFDSAGRPFLFATVAETPTPIIQWLLDTGFELEEGETREGVIERFRIELLIRAMGLSSQT